MSWILMVITASFVYSVDMSSWSVCKEAEKNLRYTLKDTDVIVKCVNVGK